MDRIICDICGSEYPANADRCPVCSYPRQGTEMAAAAVGSAAMERTKGGRFSAKNVKKRRKAQQAAARGTEERNPNKPLLIVIALLLAAIVLVSAYIAMRFFQGRDAYQPEQSTGNTTQAPQTSQPAGTTQPPAVTCKGILLENSVLELEKTGDQVQLALTLLPEDTTDVPVYETDNADVVTVSGNGLLTAVGPGTATVTITCGEAVRECTVICTAEAETTAPVQTTQTEPAAPAGLTLDQTDVSFFSEGEAFTLRAALGDTSLSGSQVVWTSSDSGVASVKNGKVTAVGKGTATITAEYDGKKASCVVRCRFQDTSWTASASDVTLAVGEHFRLTVTNGSGETADAIWTMSTEGIVSVDGTAVTARAEGTVTLSTTVDGVTLQCIVRVK